MATNIYCTALCYISNDISLRLLRCDKYTRCWAANSRTAREQSLLGSGYINTQQHLSPSLGNIHTQKRKNYLEAVFSLRSVQMLYIEEQLQLREQLLRVSRKLLWLRHGNSSGTWRKGDFRRWKPLLLKTVTEETNLCVMCVCVCVTAI
jgi:hypothetical protein